MSCGGTTNGSNQDHISLVSKTVTRSFCVTSSRIPKELTEVPKADYICVPDTFQTKYIYEILITCF